LLSIAAVAFTRELYGTDIYPVTRLMIDALSEPFTLISTIIAAYYAGELGCVFKVADSRNARLRR